MADKKIITIWDEHKLLKENIHFLKTKTKTVTFPASDFIKTIIQDLIDAYQIINCAGIAANQIGYEYQIFIGMKELINPEDAEAIEKAEAELSDSTGNPHGDNYEIYINPQIDRFDKNSINQDEEGCLSIPGLMVSRERYDMIKVRYYNIEGKVQKTTLTGFLSKLFQHELDHLNGELMLDDIVKLENIFPIDTSDESVKKYQTLFSAYSNLKK